MTLLTIIATARPAAFIISESLSPATDGPKRCFSASMRPFRDSSSGASIAVMTVADALPSRAGEARAPDPSLQFRAHANLAGGDPSHDGADPRGGRARIRRGVQAHPQ